MDFSLEVVPTWKVKAMIDYIKNHFQSKNILMENGENLTQVCNKYLKYLDKITFEAYEIKE